MCTRFWGGSSAGQSSGLIIRRSWVRAPPAPPAQRSSPDGRVWHGPWHGYAQPRYGAVMAKARSGYIQQLPSGAFREIVYAGKDPLTVREIRFRKTCKTDRDAQIELGKLLALAEAGRQPDSDVTVTQLLDQYVRTAGWDLSTRESNLGYIRRTIKPALGSMQVRKVRGPLLDTFYARLMRCGNLACIGKPFTEHRTVPDLRPDPADPRLDWQQAADRVRVAIRSGQLAPSTQNTSIRLVLVPRPVPRLHGQHRRMHHGE
jgi:hypothetical protein